MNFSKKKPSLFSNLAVLGIALTNIITILICGGFGYESSDFYLFAILFLFLVLTALHIAILVFLELQLIKPIRVKSAKEVFKKNNLSIFFTKLRHMKNVEKNILSLNLFWFILAIIYFLLVMQLNPFSNDLILRRAPYYIFKIQLFFGVATFLLGYGHKYFFKTKEN